MLLKRACGAASRVRPAALASRGLHSYLTPAARGLQLLGMLAMGASASHVRVANQPGAAFLCCARGGTPACARQRPGLSRAS
jgi:hypothetical protein